MFPQILEWILADRNEDPLPEELFNQIEVVRWLRVVVRATGNPEELFRSRRSRKKTFAVLERYQFIRVPMADQKRT